VSLSRELTKLHEETRRTTLGEAAVYYQENAPKGEFVLVVAGAPEQGGGQWMSCPWPAQRKNGFAG